MSYAEIAAVNKRIDGCDRSDQDHEERIRSLEEAVVAICTSLVGPEGQNGMRGTSTKCAAHSKSWSGDAKSLADSR